MLIVLAGIPAVTVPGTRMWPAARIGESARATDDAHVA